MDIKKMNQWGEWCIWFLNPLLLLLAIYSEASKTNTILLWFGKMHPLVLHFPIVFGIAIVIYFLFFQKKPLEENTEKLVLVGNAFMASMVALLGLFLSKQDAYDTNTLNLHKWGGLSIALIGWLLIYIKNIATNFKKITALCYLLVLLFFTHQGALLTHGENALSIPRPEVKVAEEVKVVDSSLTVYEKAIAPILAQKCVSCHGPEKVKGQLQLQSPELILKGGKNGNILNGIQNEEALLLQRIHLPNADEKHMPPDGKLQLTLEELTLLNKWVKAGGNFTKKISELAKTDSLAILAMAYKAPTKGSGDKKNNAPDLKQYNSSYLTVNYLFNGSEDIEVNFFQGSFYKTEQLKNLEKIKDNIVSLNMQGMPITKEDLAIIIQFSRLKKLNLNYTNLQLADLQVLKNISGLTNLSICGIEVNQNSLKTLLEKAPFTEVHVWTNHSSEKEFQQLSASNKKVKIIIGDNLDTEIIKLTSPIIDQDSSIIANSLDVVVKHFLKGTVVRYTTDGTDPDSLSSPIYTKKLRFTKNTILKTKAFKPGWISSDMVQKTFYKSDIHPDTIYFVTNPDKKYPGSGAKTLIDYELGEKNFSNGKWLAYKDTTMKFVIGFKQVRPLQAAHFNAYIDNGSYIFPIISIMIEGSNDGKEFKKLNEARFPSLKETDVVRENKSFSCSIPAGSAYKYYRFTLLNIKKLPNWHPGKGTPGWIFVDELFLN
jgi:mono/diheme cytochrome c family protein